MIRIKTAKILSQYPITLNNNLSYVFALRTLIQMQRQGKNRKQYVQSVSIYTIPIKCKYPAI